MTGAKLLTLIAIAALGLSACARRVTIPPEQIASRNDRAWVIKRAPAKQ